MTITNSSSDIINAETLRCYGAGERWVPEANLEGAYAFSRKMQENADSIADAVAVIGRMVNHRPYASIVVAELTMYHATELDKLASIIGQAIAAKDPTRFDERYSNTAQALADSYRS